MSTPILTPSDLELARHCLNTLQTKIYQTNVRAGWYKDPKTGRKIQRNRAEMIALAHSELSEGLEGLRKSLADDHLPNYPMIIVELADTMIRIFDLAGYLEAEPPMDFKPAAYGINPWSLGGAFTTKIQYNSERLDHKLSERAKEGGKSI